MSATDIRYGRQGGRVGGSTAKASEVLDEIHRLRLAGVADGTWPQESTDWWLQRAEYAQRRLDQTLPISPIDHKALAVAHAHNPKRSPRR